MTLYMIACSRKGYDLMQELKEKWKFIQPDCRIICKVKCSAMPEVSEKESLSVCVKEAFACGDAIVFFCAAGIAVRSIAPYLRHKSVDPGVVSVDETGKFCISLLSGHAGGANELTGLIAGALGAVPVITTATDREGKFAVDEFARKNHLKVTDWKMAKKISAAVLAGERIFLSSDIPLMGKMPEEVIIAGIKEEAKADQACEYQKKDGAENKAETGTEPGRLSIKISCSRQCPDLREGLLEDDCLQLVPEAVIVGVGCKKGTSREKIESAVEAGLLKAHIMPEAVCGVASIDLKKNEQGLLDYCKEKELPLFTYTAEELKEAEGEFEESVFVAQITGVSNVCERSAVLAARVGKEEGILISRKEAYEGVTVALAMKKGRAEF